MSLVKWIRKNERKLMSLLVIFIMVAFVGGAALQQILMRMGGGKQAIAVYGERKPFLWMDFGPKITLLDRNAARQELQVLAQLSSKEFLQSIQSPVISKQPSFKGLLLSQLLFPDTQTSQTISMMLTNAAMQDQLEIEQSDIDSFFDELHGYSDIYWILLKEESRQAGVYVTPNQAKSYLTQFIPQVTQNQRDAAAVVNGIMDQMSLTESQVVGVFADLLSVISYGDMVMSSEDTAVDQIRALVAKRNERIGSEYVSFDADFFYDEEFEPAESDQVQQFEKYKEVDPFEFTESNSYGFGYKLPARVQLEYIAVQMSDVEKIIEKPTSEEMENFYQDNLSYFVIQEKIDPNDPDSQTYSKQLTYAQVEQTILSALTSRKTNSKADEIMDQAEMLTDMGLSSEEKDSLQSGQLKAKAKDFESTASKLIEEFGVKVYTGKTGYLSLEDMAGDLYFSRLTLQGSGQQQVELSKAIFAIDELGVTSLSRYEGTAPLMWENIGPMTDSSSISIMVRIVDAKKPQAPESLNTKYSTQTLVFDDTEESDEAVYSVKEKVIEDLRLQKAYETAKTKAAEFLQSAKQTDWNKAIEAYNNTLEKPEDPNEPVLGKIALSNMSDRNIPTDADIKQIKDLIANSPSLASYIPGVMLTQRLYDLYDPDISDDKDLDIVVDFNPTLNSYAVKTISLSPATIQDYSKAKSQVAWQQDAVSAEALAVVYYNPANLFARMNFSFKEDQTSDKANDTEEK